MLIKKIQKIYKKNYISYKKDYYIIKKKFLFLIKIVKINLKRFDNKYIIFFLLL